MEEGKNNLFQLPIITMCDIAKNASESNSATRVRPRELPGADSGISADRRYEIAVKLRESTPPRSKSVAGGWQKHY